MAAEAPQPGLSTTEASQLADILPGDVLADALERRGFRVVSPRAEELEVDGQIGFPSGLDEFLAADEQLSLDAQLLAMREFWAMKGLELPELSEPQQNALAEASEAHPDWRVLPTPLFDEAMVYGAPRDVEYDQLRANPSTTAEHKSTRTRIGLFYKTQAGELVDRATYLAELEASGMAIRSADGVLWSFPVMNMHEAAEPTYGGIRVTFEQIDPLATPESLKLLYSLRAAQGMGPKLDDIPKNLLVNEFGGKVNEDGGFEDILHFVYFYADASTGTSTGSLAQIHTDFIKRRLDGERNILRVRSDVENPPLGD